MTAYVTQRLAGGFAVIAGLLVFAFLATHYIGDPMFLLSDRELTTPEDRQVLLESAGFDEPLWEQFADYMSDAVRGDFGTSIFENRPASEVVLERAPATLYLAGVTVVVTAAVAIPLAVLSARRPGGRVNIAITTVTSLLSALPSFWVALALIFLFAVKVQLLPTGGYGLKEMALPVVALSLAPIGRLTQVLETALAGEFRKQYVATARAKGLGERSIITRHVLRNAALVALTLFSAELVLLLNGAVLIEDIFAWPGVGQVMLDSVQSRDLPVVMAGVIYVGIIVVTVNLVVDLGYAWIDPRVRLS